MLLIAALVASSELPHGRPALARPATRPGRELRGGGTSPDHASPQLVAVAGAQQLVVVEETTLAPPPRRRLPELPKLTPFAQICVNLMMWWALNVVFNLANKGGTGYNKEGETSPICPNGWCVKSYSLMVCGSASPLDPEKGLGEHNYCRNPTADPGGIWCYTDAMNTKKEACAPSLLTGSIVGGKG